MKKIISPLLFLTLLLGACTSTPIATETSSATDEPSSATAEVESTASGVSDQVETSREAVVAEIENNVTAQIESSAEFSSASVGLVIPVGGTIQTGEDSRAKLSLNPEGTIVRVGPNSSFTLTEMTETAGEPKTTLQLLFGKVFVLLNGGSLEVETPSGVASVRGSLLSVQFDPQTNQIRTVCLEGHCGLENEAGEEIELTEGEAASIDETGELSDVLEIDRSEIEDWLEENPELDEFLEELPDPEIFPEDVFDEQSFGDGDGLGGDDGFGGGDGLGGDDGFGGGDGSGGGDGLGGGDGSGGGDGLGGGDGSGGGDETGGGGGNP